jgi:NAD(P)-dependent dehydrogenase (short-subunit alcohol dehydrogenase family)
MRAVVLGAETPAGRAIAAALTEAGAQLALVAAGAGADTAFEVQRLARRLGALSQAIDATNEMAVRVMTRQVSKALGGLDALFFCADLGPKTETTLALSCRFATREMARGGGAIVVASAAATPTSEGLPEGIRLLAVDVPAAPDEAWARGVFARLTDPPHT